MTVSLDRDLTFLASVRHVAEEVARPNADAVDRDARFPSEAIDALRSEQALSAFIPRDLGGGGVAFETIAAACYELGRGCGSAAMVFAMHQIKVATLVRHLDEASWFDDYLREVARSQRLIASVTSEIGTGGDMGRSIACLTPQPDSAALSFEKQAPTVSYGTHADDMFVTLRRAPDAEQSDQVIVLAGEGQFSLEQTGTWDTLGMRGTCSPGFVVRATVERAQILPTPFSVVMAESIIPVTHILWAHLWLGIATDAFDRARAFVRAAARKTPGQTPPVASRLSHLMSELSLLRSQVSSALTEFVAVSEDADRERLSTMAATLHFNNLKITASEQASKVCHDALSICGIMGFRNDTPYSVGRHLRDSLSASLMIANERIHQTNASLLLIAKDV